MFRGKSENSSTRNDLETLGSDLGGTGSSQSQRRKTLKKLKKKKGNGLPETGITGSPPAGVVVAAEYVPEGDKKKKKKKNKKAKTRKHGQELSLREQLNVLNSYLRAGIITPAEFRVARDKAISEQQALELAGGMIPDVREAEIADMGTVTAELAPVTSDISYGGNEIPINSSGLVRVEAATTAQVLNADIVGEDVVPAIVIDPDLIQRIDNLNELYPQPTVSDRASKIAPKELPLKKESEVLPTHPTVGNNGINFAVDEEDELTQAAALNNKSNIKPGRAALSEEDSFAELMREVSADEPYVEEIQKEKAELEQAKQLTPKAEIPPGMATVADKKNSLPPKEMKSTSPVEKKKSTLGMLKRAMSSPISLTGNGDDGDQKDDVEQLLKDMGNNDSAKNEPSKPLVDELKPRQQPKVEPVTKPQPDPVREPEPDRAVAVEPRSTVPSVPVNNVDDSSLDLAQLERDMMETSLRTKRKGSEIRGIKKPAKPLMMRGESVALFDLNDDKDGIHAPSRPETEGKAIRTLYSSDPEDEDDYNGLYNSGNIYNNRTADYYEDEKPLTRVALKQDIIKEYGTFREGFLSALIEQIEGTGNIAEKLFTVEFLKNEGTINYGEFKYVKAIILGQV